MTAVLVAPAGLERPEWLEVRRAGIGSSDAAAIAGFDPYRGPFEVYLDKIGELPERELGEQVDWGNLLEEPIAQRYAQLNGVHVHRCGTFAHPDRPWQMANPDRLVSSAPNAPADSILEVKTTTLWNAKDWDTDTEQLPDKVTCQVAHQLAVTGHDLAHVACLVGGQKLVVVDVARDQKLIDDLTQIEADFWQRVLNRRPPPPGGAEQTTRLLGRLYQVEPESVRVLDPAEFLPLRDAYRQTSEQLKDLERRKAEIGNQLRVLLGEKELGVIDDQVVLTYKESPRKGYTVAPTTVRTLNLKKV